MVVDDRERPSGLIEAIGRVCGVEPQVERFGWGDVLIHGRVLIERKTVSDFAASLLDGRLFSQTAGLRSQPYETLLVLEGEMTASACGKLSPAALRAAMLSLSLDWRLPILRSRDVEDTARWIRAILRRRWARADPPDWRWVTPTGQRRPERRLWRRPRRERLPPDELRRREAIRMLAQISGIGEQKARRLLDHFGSVAAVAEASLSEMARVDGIGARLAETVFEALHAGGAESPEA